MFKKPDKKILILFMSLVGILISTVILYNSELIAQNNDMIYLLDSKNNMELKFNYPEFAFTVENDGKSTKLSQKGFHGKISNTGDVYIVTRDLSLVKITQNGEQTTVLEKGSANAPIFFDHSGRYLAYLKPYDFDTDFVPLTNAVAVAVLDLVSGEEQIVFKRPRESICLFGWLGRNLLIEIPPQGNVTNTNIQKLNLNGNVSTIPGLENIPITHEYPKTSFDQKYIVYEAADYVLVVNPTAGSKKIINNAAFPKWTTKGLQVKINNKTVDLNME